MRLFLIVLAGLTAIVVMLGVSMLFAGRAVYERVKQAGNDPSKIRAVANQIAAFNVPRGYRLLWGYDLMVTKSVVLWSYDNERQFMLEGNLNEPDPGMPATVLNWKLRGCGGMFRKHDVQYATRRGSVVAQRFECRDRDYRLDVIPVNGRMAETRVLAQGPAVGWPTRSLDTFLSTIHK